MDNNSSSKFEQHFIFENFVNSSSTILTRPFISLNSKDIEQIENDIKQKIPVAQIKSFNRTKIRQKYKYIFQLVFKDFDIGKIQGSNDSFTISFFTKKEEEIQASLNVSTGEFQVNMKDSVQKEKYMKEIANVSKNLDIYISSIPSIEEEMFINLDPKSKINVIVPGNKKYQEEFHGGDLSFGEISCDNLKVNPEDFYIIYSTIFYGDTENTIFDISFNSKLPKNKFENLKSFVKVNFAVNKFEKEFGQLIEDVNNKALKPDNKEYKDVIQKFYEFYLKNNNNSSIKDFLIFSEIEIDWMPKHHTQRFIHNVYQELRNNTKKKTISIA